MPALTPSQTIGPFFHNGLKWAMDQADQGTLAQRRARRRAGARRSRCGDRVGAAGRRRHSRRGIGVNGLDAVLLDLGHTLVQYDVEDGSLLESYRVVVVGYALLGFALMALFSLTSDRKSTRLNSSHLKLSRMPSSA